MVSGYKGLLPVPVSVLLPVLRRVASSSAHLFHTTPSFHEPLKLFAASIFIFLMDDDRAKSEPNNPCPDSHHDEPVDFRIPWEELKRLENWDGDPDAMELGLPTRSGRLDDIESRYCHCMAALGYKPTGKYFAYFQKIFHEPCTCDHDHSLRQPLRYLPASSTLETAGLYRKN